MVINRLDLSFRNHGSSGILHWREKMLKETNLKPAIILADVASLHLQYIIYIYISDSTLFWTIDTLQETNMESTRYDGREDKCSLLGLVTVLI